MSPVSKIGMTSSKKPNGGILQKIKMPLNYLQNTGHFIRTFLSTILPSFFIILFFVKNRVKITTYFWGFNANLSFEQPVKNVGLCYFRRNGKNFKERVKR